MLSYKKDSNLVEKNLKLFVEKRCTFRVIYFLVMFVCDL